VTLATATRAKAAASGRVSGMKLEQELWGVEMENAWPRSNRGQGRLHAENPRLL